MKQNRNVVRLSESQLKKMISKSVKKALNEIGNTQAGQNAIAQVIGRRAAQQDRTNMNKKEEADNERTVQTALDTAYDEYNKNPELMPFGYRRLTPEYMKGYNKGVKKYPKSESRPRKSDGVNPKDVGYRLMLRLGDMQNRLNRGGEPVSVDEIIELYGMVSRLNHWMSDYLDL